MGDNTCLESNTAAKALHPNLETTNASLVRFVAV
jgi:hypothetical protein